jgi:periplasmic protein TonB
VRLDSPAVLAIAGTLAIHLLLAVAGDAIVVLNPAPQYEEPPQVELINIEPTPVKPPEPPPVEDKQEEPEAQETPKPVAQPPVQKAVPRSAPPPPSSEPPPTETSPSSGGAPIAAMEGLPPPSATGIPVVGGKKRGDAIGKGGTGTGTGTGSGAGSSELPKPVSIAVIKKQAMPKGDFGYFDASKDYPPEAKALGIEGAIRVRLLVDEAGKVKSAVLVSKLGHGLDELALQRAKQILFEPARDTDDKPVSSTVIWTFQMTLPK